MDFRTFEENADAAAERKAAMDQKRKASLERVKQNTAKYERRVEPIEKGIPK